MRRLVLVLVIAVAAAAGVLRTGGEEADGPGAASEAAVLRVVDGDTIAVRLGGRAERVHSIGGSSRHFVGGCWCWGSARLRRRGS